MITLQQYQSYFEDTAARYTRIGHTSQSKRFAIMDIDDILNGVRGELAFESPTLILEHPEGSFDFKHEKLRDSNFGAFMILQRAELNDQAKKTQVMDTCKSIGTGVIARMHYQKAQYFSGNKSVPRMLTFFDLSKVDYMKVGPILSNCYGWRFEFNLALESAIPYNPSEWL
jgi:hypothetical protein